MKKITKKIAVIMISLTVSVFSFHASAAVDRVISTFEGASGEVGFSSYAVKNFSNVSNAAAYVSGPSVQANDVVNSNNLSANCFKMVTASNTARGYALVFMYTNVTPTTAQKYLKLKIKRDYNGNNLKILINKLPADWQATTSYTGKPSSVWQDIVLDISSYATAGTAITNLLIEPIDNHPSTLGFPVTVCIDDVVLSETNTSRTSTVTTPTISISTATLTGFAYNYGSGPSAEQSYTVSGANLINDIVVTPPTNFEISLSSGTGYQSTALTLTKDGSGNVATTTIYARLKAGNAAAAYSSKITNISLGAFTQTVSASGNVNVQSLTITAASIASKVYNGNTTSGTVTSGTLSGFIGTETVTVGSAVGTYPDANVGTGKSATIVYTLANGTNGGLAANYSLANTTATGIITAKALSIGAATIASKVYDGTTTSGSVTPGTLSDFVGTETVTVSSAVGTYADANIGTGKPATVAYTLADGTNGGKAANYSLANSASTGDITAASSPIAGGNLNNSGLTDAQLANTNLTISSGEFIINDTKTVNSLTVAPGAKLTHSSGTLTATNGITLESDATGTATLMDSYSSPTINATVKQYVTAGRNWYMSSPLNNSADYTVLDKGASVAEYNETTGLWPTVTTGTLTRGKGYVQVASATQGTTGTVSFSGITNSGNVAVALTNTPDKGRGFNLVGNPYPSYLSWSTVVADNAAANMPTGTMWYRTISYNGKNAWAPNTAYSLNDIVYNGNRFYKVTTEGTSSASGGPTGSGTGISDGSVVWNYEGSIYIFATISASGVASPAIVNNLIPPMQAFWVRSNGGTLTFKNTMRSHNTGGTNALKARGNVSNDIQLLRLKVTNGVSADEAVIYASSDASNMLDTYDAPKYFNTSGSNQPEIFTQAGNEKLVINAMNDLNQGTEIPLGFATEKGDIFTIAASELKNFAPDMQVVLKDKQNNTEFNLTSGEAYEFSSGIINDGNRFSIVFRAPGSVTGLNSAEKLNTQVYVNGANQITILAPDKATCCIYNALGQRIYENVLGSSKTTINKSFDAGAYVVRLSVNGLSDIKKVIIR